MNYPNDGLRWTDDEVNFLRLNYPIKGMWYCSNKLGRSCTAIRSKANKLKTKRNMDTVYNRQKTTKGYIYCYICKEVLPESYFYKKAEYGNYGKKSSRCKECSKKENRQLYLKNKRNKVRQSYRSAEKIIFRNAKTRAKKKGIKFTIKESDIVIPKFCPIFGIKLIAFSNSDNSPTLDRLNPNKGYTKDNICIMSKKANRTKNDATSEEILKIYNWMKSKGL